MRMMVATWCANTSSRSLRLVSHRNSMGTAWRTGWQGHGRRVRCGGPGKLKGRCNIALCLACMASTRRLTSANGPPSPAPRTRAHLHIEAQHQAVDEALAVADGHVAGPAAALAPVQPGVVEPAAVEGWEGVDRHAAQAVSKHWEARPSGGEWPVVLTC